MSDEVEEKKINPCLSAYASINKETDFDPFFIDSETLKKFYERANEAFGDPEVFRVQIGTLSTLICEVFKTLAQSENI
jgi:hypothetical protein